MPDYTSPQLHPDLARFRDGTIINHPLVHFEHVSPAFYSRLNQLYEHHLQQQLGEYTPNEWDQFQSDMPPLDRLMHLIQTTHPKDDAGYYRMVGQIWTAPELLSNSSSTLSMLIVPSHANLACLMTESERAVLGGLPETIKVYRGHNAQLRDGYSWTLNRGVALQWAVGLPYNDSISTGKVATKRIIAYIDRRSEEEIIVSTEDVTDIDTRKAT
jgi:hypothetical protein